MGVTTYTQEYATPVAPARMFKALIIDSNNIVPKLMPQSIKSIENLQGDGGAGSIKKTIFAEGAHLKYMKHKIDALDTEKCICKYTLIEGDVLEDKLESVTYEVKFEPSGNGGCNIKTFCEYRAKGDAKIKEEDIKKGKTMPWDSLRLLKSTFWPTLLSMPKKVQVGANGYMSVWLNNVRVMIYVVNYVCLLCLINKDANCY